MFKKISKPLILKLTKSPKYYTASLINNVQSYKGSTNYILTDILSFALNRNKHF